MISFQKLLPCELVVVEDGYASDLRFRCPAWHVLFDEGLGEVVIGVATGWQRVDETRDVESEKIHTCSGKAEIPRGVSSHFCDEEEAAAIRDHPVGVDEHSDWFSLTAGIGIIEIAESASDQEAGIGSAEVVSFPIIEEQKNFGSAHVDEYG